MRTFDRRRLLIVIGTLAAACSGVPARLGSPVITAVPTGPERPIQAEACGFQLLLFFPINVNDRMQRAARALEAEAAGDFITDVRIQESWTYGLVGTQYCTILDAKAIADARLKPDAAAQSFPYRLDQRQVLDHFATHPRIEANTARQLITLTMLSGGKVERLCQRCQVRTDQGTMEVGSEGQVCFEWKQISYPIGGCFEVIQTSKYTFMLRGLARQAPLEYSIRP